MADLSRALQGLSMMSTGVGNAMMGYQMQQDRQLQRQQYYDQLRKQEERVAARDQFNQQMAQQKYDRNVSQDAYEKGQNEQAWGRQQRIDRFNLIKEVGDTNPLLGAELLGKYLENNSNVPNQQQSNTATTQTSTTSSLSTDMGGLGSEPALTPSPYDTDLSGFGMGLGDLIPNALEAQQPTVAPMGTPTAVETPAHQGNYTSRLTAGAQKKIAAENYKALFPKVRDSIIGYANNSADNLSRISNVLETTTKADINSVPAGEKVNTIEVFRSDEPEIFKVLELPYVGMKDSPYSGKSAFVNKDYLEAFKMTRLRSAVASKVKNIFKGEKLTKADLDALRQMDDLPVSPKWDYDEIKDMKSDKLARKVADYAHLIASGKVAVQRDSETGITMTLQKWQTKSSYQALSPADRKVFNRRVAAGAITPEDIKRMK